MNVYIYNTEEDVYREFTIFGTLYIHIVLALITFAISETIGPTKLVKWLFEKLVT